MESNNAGGWLYRAGYPRNKAPQNPAAVKLFFLNLGGYKPNDLNIIIKCWAACADKSAAVQQAKQLRFTCIPGSAAYFTY